MVRRFYERVGAGGHEFDLYQDSEVGKFTSYALRSFLVLNALKQGPDIKFGEGVESYSAKLPQFDEVTRLNGGFLTPSPHKKGVYWLVMDERLKPEEKLAVAFHEIAHLAGGYNDNEKKTQSNALEGMRKILTNYELLSGERSERVIQERTGFEYRADEKSPEELGKALRYLADTSNYFAIGQSDLRELGVNRVNSKNLERLLGFLFIGFGIISIPKVITGNVVSNISQETLNYFLSGLSFLIGFALLTYRKILFKTIR